MRDYTRLPYEAFRKELTEYALQNAGKGGDLCFAAAIRLSEYYTRLRELEKEEEEDDDGLDTD